MTITLAIIAGNVERYIERFLTAFAPLVDEIVIVRAIGFQDSDGTLETAQEVIHFINQSPSTEHQAPKKLITSTYCNRISHTDWPHVDDFAAARQQAFDLSTGDWIIWADTDDVITGDSIAIIRSAIEKHGADYDAFSVEYHVPEDGLRVNKERVVRRGSGAWRHPIHEEYAFTDPAPRIIHVRDAVITHMPAGSRKPNDERNLRILRSMPRESMTPGHRFHLIQSLRALGHTSESIREACDLLKDPKLGEDERYELLMNLGELCPTPAEQGNIYLQALGVNPRRREAYGELAIWSIITGRLTHALGFATAMMGIPRPADYMWNTRAMYYGWYGKKVYAMALRVNGQHIKADAIQFNHFRKHGSKISLLHATRGRGKAAYKIQHEWLTAAADPDAIEHIFAIDADDETSIGLAYQRAVLVQPGGGCVRAWNAAAASSTGQILVQMSDDFHPPMHWDQLILDRIPDPEYPAVLAVSDGHRKDDLLCMAICTRARYLEQLYPRNGDATVPSPCLFHPDFEEAAMFSDNYFTDRAYRDNVVIEARDIVFEHKHPAFDPSVQLDATYAIQNAPEKYQKGEAIFKALVADDVRRH